jgi:hypothetical protein
VDRASADTQFLFELLEAVRHEAQCNSYLSVLSNYRTRPHGRERQIGS